MTTCPRCGRVADELVCAECGMSLALARRRAEPPPPESPQPAAPVALPPPSADLMDELAAEDEDAETGRDVRVLRLAALVVMTCLLAAAAAIVLLHQRGSTPHNDVGLVQPTGSNAAPSGATPTSRPSSAPSARHSTQPTSPATPSSSKPKPTASQVAKRSSSSAPSRTTSTTRSGAPPAARSVHLAKGGLDPSCGPHCYQLVVTLSDFAAGAHHITCLSQHGGQFGSYTTSATTSAGCADRRPHDVVWVLVDGSYRSNTVTF
jgi:hypothetical protein